MPFYQQMQICIVLMVFKLIILNLIEDIFLNN
ncbi:Uncharacterised protein [Mycobacterium tuberculosis]|nr:Uncharacterised protein [Mycobacterium tuberculosis]